VLRNSASEAEMELAYPALQQLFRPGLDGLERLPGPQRDALGVAFGLTHRRPAGSATPARKPAVSTT
jgi:hypothetical protein